MVLQAVRRDIVGKLQSSEPYVQTAAYIIADDVKQGDAKSLQTTFFAWVVAYYK